MAVSPYLQLDVFSLRPGGGNPLGVVLDGRGWRTEDMQAFATWTNLVETTFLLPPTDARADYRVRIFTPYREIPFAGHPSVGSAHAAIEAALVSPRDGQLVQECGAGLLPVRVVGTGTDRRIAVEAPRCRVLSSGPDASPLLGSILEGLEPGALPPALVEGGRRWWLAELGEESALRAWRPDHAQIARLATQTDCLGLCVFARSHADDYELVVRAFPAGAGIVEDPASGAANGLIAAYIHAEEPHSPLAAGYRVSQGREIGKDARLDVDVAGNGAVWVGGATVTVLRGEVDWPRSPERA